MYYFTYLDFFTYLNRIERWSAQRGLDNQGSTVPIDFLGSKMPSMSLHVSFPILPIKGSPYYLFFGDVIQIFTLLHYQVNRLHG